MHPSLRNAHAFLSLALASMVVYAAFARRQNKNATAGARNIDDMIVALNDRVAKLKSMKQDGLKGDYCASSDDIIWLYTRDPQVAKKYGMHEANTDFNVEEMN